MRKLLEKFNDLKDDKKLLAVFGIFAVLLLTTAATYAFFSYSKEGLVENSLETGAIKFIYNESSRVGNGISLEDAMPMPDEVGKVQDKYFDFSVTGTSGTAKIDYEITARKTSTSDNIDEYVKLYLTKVNGSNEEEKVLSIYNDLTQSTNQLAQNHTEKTLYRGSIPAGSTNYTENYRLRMWLTDGLEYTQTETGSCSDPTYTTELDCVGAHKDWTRVATPMTEKAFTVKINVYANGELATQQEIADANSVGLNSMTINNVNATFNENSTRNYDYYAAVGSDITEVEVDIGKKVDGQTVTVESITESEANNIVGVSTTVRLPVVAGNNYYKITVTSQNKENTEIYVLKIYCGDAIVGDSLLSVLKDNNLSTGYYNFEVAGKGEIYKVHLYSYEGDQTWSGTTTFGDENDVSTTIDGERTYAQNMVIVKVNGDLTIERGALIQPYYNATTGYGGPKGFVIYVTGALTNNGTIDNSHGAYAIGQDVYLWKNADGTYEYVPSVGGIAGVCYDSTNNAWGESGADGANRQTGGGGSGRLGLAGYDKCGGGGNGTSYSGGVGGDSTNGISAPNDGGQGGCGNVGGAGNPAGTKTNGTRGKNGTGGLLVIYANDFENNNTVSTLGNTGGVHNYQGGGSSGGGSINIFYNQTVTNGTLNAAGGARVGANGGKGGAGGTGSISVGSISNDSYTSTYKNY